MATAVKVGVVGVKNEAGVDSITGLLNLLSSCGQGTPTGDLCSLYADFVCWAVFAGCASCFGKTDVRAPLLSPLFDGHHFSTLRGELAL